jgi:CRP-like cAMP-binding protein
MIYSTSDIKYPNLYNSIRNYINITPDEYLPLEERLIVKQLKEREFFVQEGEIIKYLGFINDGLMVNYRIDEKGDRHVIQIRWTQWWMGDLYSFFSRKPTFSDIICYKPTEILLINHETFDYITENFPKYEKFFRIAFQKSYISTLNQVYNLHSKSAEERYLDLIENVPTILDDIPHYLIASYLNIRPQSLSRLRKNIQS